MLPHYQVIASTFDDFTQYLLPFSGSLPVYNQEIGDTWIYVCNAMPVSWLSTHAFSSFPGQRVSAYGIEKDSIRAFSLSFDKEMRPLATVCLNTGLRECVFVYYDICGRTAT